MSTALGTPHSDGMIYALEEINSFPVTFDHPLFRHYPAMKLGKSEAVDFYSYPLAHQTIAILNHDFQEYGQNHQWLLTAPAFFHLPAAANLLARKVHSLLQQQGITIDLVEPRLQQEQIQIRTQDEINNYYNYSKNTLQQRIAERQRVQQTTDTHILQPLFKEKSVIVINDINVTGTQQHFMRKRFAELGVKACHWLYIFTIDRTLAERNPEIEFQINNSQLLHIDDFAKLLINPETQHTARCMGRFFNESHENFCYLVSKLDTKLRNRLYQLALQEGRYNNEFFNAKMEILNTRELPLTAASH